MQLYQQHGPLGIHLQTLNPIMYVRPFLVGAPNSAFERAASELQSLTPGTLTACLPT